MIYTEEGPPQAYPEQARRSWFLWTSPGQPGFRDAVTAFRDVETGEEDEDDAVKRVFLAYATELQRQGNRSVYFTMANDVAGDQAEGDVWYEMSEWDGNNWLVQRVWLRFAGDPDVREFRPVREPPPAPPELVHGPAVLPTPAGASEGRRMVMRAAELTPTAADPRGSSAARRLTVRRSNPGRRARYEIPLCPDDGSDL